MKNITINYELFKVRNNTNKDRNIPIGRILRVDLRENFCVVEVSNYYKNVKISDLVKVIMNGRFCVSNPSILTNYNFNKYINYTKKDKRKKNFNSDSKLDDKKRNKMLNTDGLIFHGSDGGIKGRIRYDANKGLCDFGYGFYTGYDLRQAENRVSNKKDGIVYAFKYNPSDIKIYEFNDIILWALFVGYNREIIDIRSKKLLRELKEINNYDIIIGYIADDKISAIYNDFLAKNITDVCLAECLKLVKYGKQVVFKTDKAIDSLKGYGSYKLTKEMKDNSKMWSSRLKTNMEIDIEKYKSKYRRIGKYLDEILEEYK